MDSPDLNPPSPADDPLEKLLRTPAPALPDDGFSARVQAALPPPTPATSGLWKETLMCLAGAIVGVILAAATGVTWSSLDAVVNQATPDFANLAGVFSNPQLLVALAVAGWSLLLVAALDRFALLKARARPPGSHAG